MATTCTGHATALGFLPRGGFLSALLLFGLPCCSALAPSDQEPQVAAPPQEAGLDASTNAGMKVLRARLLGQRLSEASRLVSASTHVIFGSEAEVELRMDNPFGREFSLREPQQGFLVQVDLRMERWLAFGAVEVLRERHVAVLNSGVHLGVGERLSQTLVFPVPAAGPNESLRRIEIAATLRCDGLEIDDAAYPVNAILFQPTQYQVFPGNWEPLAKDPLGSLRRLITLPQTDLDRHVLVAAASLTRQQHVEAVGLLVRGLEQVPNVRRMDTLMAALRFITGRDYGENPVMWKRWWEERTMGLRD